MMFKPQWHALTFALNLCLQVWDQSSVWVHLLLLTGGCREPTAKALIPPWVQARAHTHARTNTHAQTHTHARTLPVHSAASVPRSTSQKPATGDVSCDNPLDTCFYGSYPTVDLVAGNLRWSTEATFYLLKVVNIAVGVFIDKREESAGKAMSIFFKKWVSKDVAGRLTLSLARTYNINLT